MSLYRIVISDFCVLILYSYPYGHEELAICEDIDQVWCELSIGFSTCLESAAALGPSSLEVLLSAIPFVSYVLEGKF